MKKMKRIRLFYKILKSVHIMGFIYGFIALFFIASALLTIIEPQLKSMGNSLWFCFASVTTIGYGDYAPVTPLGRIITVIISIYGILVVSLLTAAIVRFIGAIQKIKLQDGIDSIVDKLENLDQLDKDELKKISKDIRDREI